MFDIWDKIVNFIYELFYYLGIFFMKILHYLYQMFGVFVGTQKVTYNNSDRYLINIFFSNSTVTTVYAGMALIGIVFLVVMTILAVYKKMHDLGDRMQSSLGEILRKALTSFLFIISMNVIVLMTVNISNTMMRSVEYLFDNAYTIGQVNSITFTSKQYAAMARIFNTIGNYSLSKSYTSRYNLNTCFNEIRPDMQYLEQTNVFRFTYDTEVDGEKVESWQSVLSQIARTADLSKELPLDEYNVSVSAALLDAMEYCRQNNNDMVVLQKYTQGAEQSRQTEADIATLFWLAATVDAAHNTSYNGEYADISDPVRNPYRIGQRSIFSLSQVEEDFNLSFSKFGHLFVIIGGALMCYEFIGIVINCISRLYYMLILYLIAPPLIATAPFDDGEKFKQWSQAFIVQTFGIFGTIIAIRLMMLLVPIIYDSRLVIINTGFFGMLAKTIMVFTMAYSTKRASGLIGSILSGNGGGASARELDTYDSMMNGSVGRGLYRVGRFINGSLFNRRPRQKSQNAQMPNTPGANSLRGNQGEGSVGSGSSVGGSSGGTGDSITNTGANMRNSLNMSNGSNSSPAGRTDGGGNLPRGSGMGKVNNDGAAGGSGSNGSAGSAGSAGSSGVSGSNGSIGRSGLGSGGASGASEGAGGSGSGAEKFKAMDGEKAKKRFHMSDRSYASTKKKLEESEVMIEMANYSSLGDKE